MIGGLCIILVAIWFYQAAIQTNKENTMLWVAIGAVTFFVIQMILVKGNVFILESIKDSQSAGMIEGRDFYSIGARVTQDTRGGASGFFLSVFLELFPPIGGIIGAAFVRTMFLLKLAPTPGNLVSGFMDMIKGILKGIKDSFTLREQK